jgi:hypothetical protein
MSSSAMSGAANHGFMRRPVQLVGGCELQRGKLPDSPQATR